jgi:hypothetical protein
MQTHDIALKTSWLGFKNNLVRWWNQLKPFDKSNSTDSLCKLRTLLGKQVGKVIKTT